MRSVPRGAVCLLGALFIFLAIRWHFTLAQSSLRLDGPWELTVYEADFLCFYTAGKLAATGVVDAYNHEKLWAEQASITARINRQNPQYLFAYPPMVAAVMVPFAKLQYLTSYYLFMVVSLVVSAVSIWFVLPPITGYGKRLFLSFGIPLVFLFLSVVSFGWGQLSALGLAVFAVTFSLRKQMMPFLAGLVFAFGLYKPPLFVGYAIIALLAREWRFLAGAFTGAIFLSTLSLFLFGVDSNMAFFHVASSYLYGVELPSGQRLPPGKGMGLLSTLMVMSGSIPHGWVLFLISALTLLVVHMRLFFRKRFSNPNMTLLEQSSRITLSYFLSVQAINYDAALLLVPLVINGVVFFSGARDAIALAIMVLVACGLNLSAVSDSENGAGVSIGFCMVSLLWLEAVWLWHRFFGNGVRYRAT